MKKTGNWCSGIEGINFVHLRKNAFMTTYELKNSLIDKISNIEDSEFFEALNLFMDFKLEKRIYQTTTPQKLVIQEGINQLYRKEGISDSDFNLNF